jgi:hypothetical protein
MGSRVETRRFHKLWVKWIQLVQPPCTAPPCRCATLVNWKLTYHQTLYSTQNHPRPMENQKSYRVIRSSVARVAGV